LGGKIASARLGIQMAHSEREELLCISKTIWNSQGRGTIRVVLCQYWGEENYGAGMGLEVKLLSRSETGLYRRCCRFERCCKIREIQRAATLVANGVGDRGNPGQKNRKMGRSTMKKEKSLHEGFEGDHLILEMKTLPTLCGHG